MKRISTICETFKLDEVALEIIEIPDPLSADDNVPAELGHLKESEDFRATVHGGAATSETLGASEWTSRLRNRRRYESPVHQIWTARSMFAFCRQACRVRN
jgi:hypothetical protein